MSEPAPETPARNRSAVRPARKPWKRSAPPPRSENARSTPTRRSGARTRRTRCTPHQAARRCRAAPGPESIKARLKAPACRLGCAAGTPRLCGHWRRHRPTRRGRYDRARRAGRSATPAQSSARRSDSRRTSAPTWRSRRQELSVSAAPAGLRPSHRHPAPRGPRADRHGSRSSRAAARAGSPDTGWPHRSSESTPTAPPAAAEKDFH